MDNNNRSDSKGKYCIVTQQQLILFSIIQEEIMSLINDIKERTPVSFADNKAYMNMYGYIVNDVQFHLELPFKLISN